MASTTTTDNDPVPLPAPLTDQTTHKQAKKLSKQQYKLRTIQENIDNTEQCTVESTRRMVEMCMESRAVGAKTADMLVQQGEQLHGVEQQLDHVGEEIKTAQRQIKRMNRGFWYDLIACFFTCCIPTSAKKKKNKNKKNQEDKNGGDEINMDNKDNGDAASNNAPTSWLSKWTNGNSASANGGDSAKLRQDLQSQPPPSLTTTATTRTEEIDGNLGIVANLVGDLRNMALDMGEEITKQNAMVDRISTKAKANEIGVDKAFKGANELLK